MGTWLVAEDIVGGIDGDGGLNVISRLNFDEDLCPYLRLAVRPTRLEAVQARLASRDRLTSEYPFCMSVSAPVYS